MDKDRLLDAWRETLELQKANPDIPAGDPSLPIIKMGALIALANLEESYKQGDRGAVLEAVRKCAEFGMHLPDWAASAFSDSYDKAVNGELKSWDEAWGPTRPKGTHAAAHRKRRRFELPVFIEVTLAARDGRAIDETLFEEVGRRYGLGKTLAANYYYGAKKLLANVGDLAASFRDPPKDMDLYRAKVAMRLIKRRASAMGFRKS